MRRSGHFWKIPFLIAAHKAPTALVNEKLFFWFSSLYASTRKSFCHSCGLPTACGTHTCTLGVCKFTCCLSPTLSSLNSSDIGVKNISKMFSFRTKWVDFPPPHLLSISSVLCAGVLVLQIHWHRPSQTWDFPASIIEPYTTIFHKKTRCKQKLKHALKREIHNEKDFCFFRTNVCCCLCSIPYFLVWWRCNVCDYASLPTACMPYLGCIQVWLCLPVSRVKTWFQIERIGSTTPKNRKVKETYFVS